MADSSDDNEEKVVKQEFKTDPDGNIKTDPEGNPIPAGPKKLESGQLEDETLAEFKERLVKVWQI